jgi:hypothetical protein
MLPTMHVSVPMPRIKNDPRLAGIAEMDNEDAAMIRAWVNAEASIKLNALYVATYKARLRCSFIAACIFLLATGAASFFESSASLLLLGMLVYPGLSFIRRINDDLASGEARIAREKSEKLAEYGLCPPIHR